MPPARTHDAAIQARGGLQLLVASNGERDTYSVKVDKLGDVCQLNQDVHTKTIHEQLLFRSSLPMVRSALMPRRFTIE